MVRRASLAHHWIGASNSFDKLTTPSANDPEIAEGHPEQATNKSEESFDTATKGGLAQDMVSKVEPRVEGSPRIEEKNNTGTPVVNYGLSRPKIEN